MKTRSGRAMACAILVLALSWGCDSGSDDDDDDNVLIDGLWSLVTPEGEDEDVQYVLFDGNEGAIFDYMGDEFDQGDDCYLIEPFTLQRLDENSFRLTPDEPGSSPVEINVQINGNEMTVSGPFLPEATFVRSNRSTAEFTPECTD